MSPPTVIDGTLHWLPPTSVTLPVVVTDVAVMSRSSPLMLVAVSGPVPLMVPVPDSAPKRRFGAAYVPPESVSPNA